MSGYFIPVGLAVIIWVYLLAAHGRFWRADQRLPEAPDAPGDWPEVVAIVPARNEATVIGTTVAAHMQSAYGGKFSLIVVDDHSSDGTAEIAQTAGGDGPHGFTLTHAPALRHGWSGKLWALNHGLCLARDLAPDARYILFTDADIVHAPGTLARLVAKAEGEQLALVSLMARLDARGPWAAMLVPAFVFFFQKLYPFAMANDPAHPQAAAAGGCVLVRREALDEAGGLAPIRADLIDDCALARLIKGTPPERPIWLGLTTSVVSLRDNRALSSIWQMVERTAFVQLDRSVALVAGTVAAMALIYLAGPLAVLSAPWHGDIWAAVAGGTVWAAMVLAYRPTAALYRQPWFAGLALPLSAVLYSAMTVSSAISDMRGHGGAWKGRIYPPTCGAA